VRSARELVADISDDPKKLRRAFTFVWVVSYLMLILGFLLIVVVFVYGL